MLAVVEWPDVLREIEGGKQRVIAGYAGVTQQAVSDWFALKSFPDADNIRTLADVLDRSEDELAGAVQRARRQPPRPARSRFEERLADAERRLDAIEERLAVDYTGALAEVRGMVAEATEAGLEELDSSGSPGSPDATPVVRSSRSRAR